MPSTVLNTEADGRSIDLSDKPTEKRAVTTNCSDLKNVNVRRTCSADHASPQSGSPYSSSGKRIDHDKVVADNPSTINSSEKESRICDLNRVTTHPTEDLTEHATNDCD